MYARNQSYQEKANEIPDNYSGVALSKSEKQENVNNNLQKEEEKSQNAMNFIINEPKKEECRKGTGGGILSGLLEKFGLREIDGSDITLLALAILLLSGDDDDYIWIFLLLLLIVR